MIKIRLFVLMLLILGGSLVGCKSDEPLNDTTHQVFMADVITSDGSLLISPDKDTVEFSSSDRISVAVNEAEIIDGKGDVADIDILKSGDRIKIFYNGMIAESYPAQITADRIELIGRNHVIDGFLALIDDLYQEDSGLNGGITMIAFDTSEWTMLTEIETEIILAIVEEKYELEVVVGTFDELAEQELIDKENLYFENGILIEIKGIEINKDKNKVECSIKKWRSGLGAIGWDAKAKFNKDTWEITRSGMRISSSPDTSLPDKSDEESNKETDTLDNSTNELDELEGVWIETEYEAYETGIMDVRVKWFNTLNDDMMFGEFFTLEENVNGNWHEVNKKTDINYGFDLIGYGLTSNEARWHTYHLIPYTDGLSSGEYRISATFMRTTLDGNDYGAGNYPEYQIYGYFTVGDRMIKRNISVLDNRKIEYLNEEYHFGIYLPKEWEGLQVITSKETGDNYLDELFSRIDKEFIVMNIRHPNWTKEEPYQDISFAIFRTEQWNKNVAKAVDDDFDLLPLRIPGGGREFIMRSNPMAYNSSFKGHSQVVEIIGDGHFSSFVHDY